MQRWHAGCPDEDSPCGFYIMEGSSGNFSLALVWFRQVKSTDKSEKVITFIGSSATTYVLGKIKEYAGFFSFDFHYGPIPPRPVKD